MKQEGRTTQAFLDQQRVIGGHGRVPAPYASYMPSQLHEALILLFRNRPALAPELLRDVLHVELPRYTDVRVDSADLTDLQPAEYRADLVILLLDDQPVFGIVVEVQLAPDERKTSSGRCTLRTFARACAAPCACWS